GRPPLRRQHEGAGGPRARLRPGRAEGGSAAAARPAGGTLAAEVRLALRGGPGPRRPRGAGPGLGMVAEGLPGACRAPGLPEGGPGTRRRARPPALRRPAPPDEVPGVARAPGVRPSRPRCRTLPTDWPEDPGRAASRHDEAAADVVGLAGDHARLVAGEVDGQRGDLLRLQ